MKSQYWKKFSVFLAIIVSIPLSLHLLGLTELLRYEKMAVVNHQYWRWFTGHWVHLSWGHLLMNLLALLIMMLTFIDSLRIGQWLVLLLGLTVLVSVLFFVFKPELVWYVGLSGVLHGVFVFLLLHDQLLTWLHKSGLLGLVAFKLGWEQFLGPLPGSAELAGGPVVVDAHLYGALCAVLLFLVVKTKGVIAAYLNDA